MAQSLASDQGLQCYLLDLLSLGWMLDCAAFLPDISERYYFNISASIARIMIIKYHMILKVLLL